MWNPHIHPIDRHTTQVSLSFNGRSLQFGEAIDLWKTSDEFRTFLTALMGQSSFDAFFWETPAVTESSLDQPFEFVLIESQALVRLRPDFSPFAPHFRSHPAEQVLTFPNLGGDARLIVPAPLASDDCYGHLARFLRTAPRSQVHAFWCKAGHVLSDALSGAPVWLSTAGLGVTWLHLRLDTRPKYYRYAPYRSSYPSNDPSRYSANHLSNQ